MKKFSLILAILLVLSLVFSACQSSTPTDKPDSETKVTQKGDDDKTPTNPPETNPPVEEGYDGSEVTIRF